jgi:hypothetical protein
LVLVAGRARAQSAPPPPPVQKPPAPRARTAPNWTVEAYGGRLVGQSPTRGDPGAPFAAGEAFTAVSGSPSRAVSSWRFGDGAMLFNQVNAQFGSQFGQRFSEMVPLDGVLRSAAARRTGGVGFGARLTRVVTPRFGIEVGVDRSDRPLRLTGAAKTAIEAARASFESAFTGLLNLAPQTGLRVTSTATPVEPDGGTMSVSGALVISLVRRGRLGAHAVAGAAGVFSGTEAAEVQLQGSYQFSFLGQFPINETDTVTMRVTDRDRVIAGLFGGGVTIAISARQELRVGFRVLASANHVTTAVTASPSVVVSAAQPIALPSNTVPTIQFSSLTGTRSSLSGGSVDLTTFTGSGLDLRGQLTVGYGLRF